MTKKKKRTKYGLRKGCLKYAFVGIAEGDIRDFPLEDVNISSFRTRAAELNIAAGYTKYSVHRNELAGLLQVKNNG